MDLFGIIIECQRTGGYLYYIANPEDIDDDDLKKWMLDSFALGNIIRDNLQLKDRILVENIPSGREHLMEVATMKTAFSVSYFKDCMESIDTEK